MKRYIVTALVATSIVGSAVERASANGGDFLAGALIGGIAGAAINHEVGKRQRAQQQSTARVAAPSYSPTRAQNAQIQTALNYFGYPAGSPDGVFGPNSRAAVAAYQMDMGTPSTGYITEYETSFLLGSYQRAQAGGAYVLQQASSTPGGMRGVLQQWHMEQISPPGSTMAAAPAVPAVPAAPEPAAATPAEPTSTTVSAEPASPALPNFMGGAGEGTQVSLASNCNKVSLMTSTNGGFTTIATMTDPAATLNEQLCLARTYAIATGEELVKKVQGYTPAQIAQQCGGIGDAMADTISSLSYDQPATVLQETGTFIKSTGMASAQLENSAKICLSVGYRTDNLPTAIGSALILVAVGDQPYAELLGHHLELGLGTAQRDDLAKEWYDMSIQSLESGATPVFAPGQPERTQLIKAAVFGTDATPPVVPTTAPSTGAKKMPGFAVKN